MNRVKAIFVTARSAYDPPILSKRKEFLSGGYIKSETEKRSNQT